MKNFYLLQTFCLQVPCVKLSQIARPLSAGIHNEAKVLIHKHSTMFIL